MKHGKAGTSGQSFRVAMYSHDTCGLGHIRRNLLIARHLTSVDPRIRVLLISGAHEAGQFELPNQTDVLTLPGISKQPDASYRTRRLGIPVQETIRLRSHIIRAGIEAFHPDLLIVDNVPGGVGGELIDSLKHLQHRGTRCVLGLRDILDHPDAIKREWTRAGNFALIQKYYNDVWIYGDPCVFDGVDRYGFPEGIRDKTTYTGYLNPIEGVAIPGDHREESSAEFDSGYSLCTVGGGQDGLDLATSFAIGSQESRLSSVIMMGAYMPGSARSHLHTICDQEDHIQLTGFVRQPLGLYQNAGRIVSMGGYNTTCELLTLGKNVLIVPRVFPRLEQWLRASRLSELGHVHMIHPADATPQRIAKWLSTEPDPMQNSRPGIDMNGLNTLTSVVTGMNPVAACQLINQSMSHAESPVV